MQLADADILTFIELHKKETGVVLTLDEARDKAGRLLRLVEAVYKDDFNRNHNTNIKHEHISSAPSVARAEPQPEIQTDDSGPAQGNTQPNNQEG